MSPIADLDHYGIQNPPAVIQEAEDEALAADRDRSAEKEFDLDRWADGVIAGLAELVADAEAGRIGRFEPLLGQLEEVERDLAHSRSECLTTLSAASSMRKDAFRLPESAGRVRFVKQITRLTDRASQLIAVADRVLPAYRDTRWELMAIEAEQQDPGNAPVFDDPEQMIGYIRARA